MIYSINYDLNRPGQSYTELHDAIKSCGVWWHYLDSHWLIETQLTANGIWDKISGSVDKNDNVLIVGITQDYSGWLSPKAWEWIKARRGQMAA